MKLFSGKVRKDEKKTLHLLALFGIIFSNEFRKGHTATLPRSQLFVTGILIANYAFVPDSHSLDYLTKF